MEWFFRYQGWIFLIGVVVIIIVSVILYRRYEKASTTTRVLVPLIAFFIVIAFGIALLVASFFLQTVQLEPRVDVSPIERLTDEHMELVEDVVLQLQEDNPAVFRGVQPWRGTQVSRLRIGVTIYDDEAQAITGMDWRRPSTGIRRNRRYREVVNDNQTQAILMYCINNYSFPSPDRLFVSYVRIGNVVFRLNEVRPRHDLDNNYSSQFIARFVERLEEAQSERMN